MPENPNIDPESGSDGYYNANVTMATNNNNNNRKQGIPRVSSANNQYFDIATQLLGKAGSDLEELFIAAARDGLFEKIEHFLTRNRSDYAVSIDVKDKKTGNTPLIWAAKRGHAKIVQLLLRHGADITLRNYEGQTAVEVASPTIKSMLLESVERSTEASHQLLLQAAWQGDIKVVSRLLSQKKVLDINCQNADGYTPILLATRDMQLFEKIASQMTRNYNPVDVVNALLSARADLHASDGDGKTCLHHASQSKAQIAQTVVTTIISGEPNLEQKDKRCFAPLHCASLTGNADCISALLDGGSEINSRGFAGATALHITSYNNHEKATTVLLEHGANVTLTDDRGLTPFDFAKTRKMKKKLQEAWAEVVNTKPKPSLGPIRAHSKEDLRTSVEDLTKRKKGEVIFEGLPSNPFSDSSKKDSLARNVVLHRSKSLRDLNSLRFDILHDLWFPKNMDVTLSRYKKDPRGITRHLSLKEKSNLEDEPTQTHLRDNVRKLGQVRNQQKPSPLPRTKSRSTERLPMISPDRMGSDCNLESPVHFGRNSRTRRSFEDRKTRGRRVAPVSTRESTNLTDDVFDRLTPGPPSPTPSVHRRSESDPFKTNPNLMDIAASCEPYLQGGKRGRSYSVNSNPANDFEVNRFTPHLREVTSFQREATATTLQRDITLMSVCSNRTESRMSTNSNSPRMLNLGQMLSKSKTPVQHMYGPGSNKVIPPTPTFITQRCDSKTEQMDVSPRSDDDVESRPELLRSKSIFKDEFVLEESRPKDPMLKSSSSASDTVSSSGSSHTSPSPRDSPLLNKGKLTGPGKNNKVKINQQGSGLVTGAKQSNYTTSKQDLKVTGVNTKEETKGGNVQKAKGGNSVVTGNSKYVSILHNMAMRNLAVQNATKQTNAKRGAKTGGTIVMHGNGIDSVNVVGESSESDTKDSNGNIVTKNVGSAENKTDPKQNETSAQIDASRHSGNEKANTNKNTGQPLVNPRKRAAQKQMQNVLQVVPTKLTENIVRTAPKGKSGDEKTVKKNVSNKTGENVSKTLPPESVSNVNIQLPQSAQVQHRIAPSERAKTPAEGLNQGEMNGIKETECVKVSKSQTSVNSNNSSTVTTKTTTPISQTTNSNQSAAKKRINNQVKSAQDTSRDGSQSRNTTFNGSRSASVNQRQMGNVRKTSSGYTPRFQSNVASKVSNLAPKKDNKNVSDSNSTYTESTADNNATGSEGLNESTKKTDITTSMKTAKSSSPTELVTPTVCRSASMSKSYNMGAPQTLTKSSSSGSMTSETSTTASKSTVNDKSDKNLKKHSVVSKSVSEPMTSSKVSNSSIVSKSISQMPSVGTVTNDKTQSKGLPRSASMSTIEETQEKKLMSSSDTKIECVNTTSKGRPSSDGPAGVASAKDGGNNEKNSPLVDILPGGAVRINKRSYIDTNNPITTPVIVNPFEELEQKRALTATDIGFVVDKPSVERSKTQTSLKSKNSRTVRKAPSSAKSSSASIRGSSGRSKKSRKDSNKSDNESTRPKSGKSGKRIRSGKRKRKIPDNLAKENEKSDVALIGGIGWQIATSCIDKSEADAVIVSQIDSSESDGEEISIIEPLKIPSPDSNLHLSSNLDTPSSMISPRFKEVRPADGDFGEVDLAFMENDGYRPMNLDMTQSSLSQQNRAGVIITQDMPGDIGNFLSKLKEDESATVTDTNEEFLYEDDYEDDMYDDEDIENLLHKGVIIGQLTPIPESPSLTQTSSTMKHVAKTVEAISKFDKAVNDDDLSKLLDSTPRDKASLKHYGSIEKGKKSTPRNSDGSVRTQTKDIRQNVPNSGVSRNTPSRNSSSKTVGSRVSSLSAEIKERANRVFGNNQNLSQSGLVNSLRNSSDRSSSSNSLRKHPSKEKLSDANEPKDNLGTNATNLSLKQGDANFETKERIDSKVHDLKRMLSEKMQTTQKMLEESDRQRQKSGDSEYSNDLKLDIKELTIENVKALDTSRLDDDMKSTRSSRKERRFSETKKTDEDDDETKEAINEILSTTFPSTKSNVKSFDSFRSRSSSTLTEADRSVLKQMIQQNQSSPFHAKEGSVRVSSSFDETVTLNKDNPELMKRFHANDFKIGQKVKAMIEAGADPAKVREMVKADNEAKQLAKIMNSFRQMELYAGPHSSNNRSAKKETPRREGDNVVSSMSKFDHHHSSHHSGMPPRPGSAGAGRLKPGKFTEIKGKSASHVASRTHSPIDVPKDLADEFKRSPFKQVSTNQEENFDNLANVIKVSSQDSEEDHFSLNYEDDMERADSACTTLSSHSSIMEETIQWKKGNVLGKGAFGTVWCGLTSEGQLIAVKQIELNTTNQNKAKKEYEKVQEEVELLKTLEHKNIVGYMGTSLEDSIVSIFMQFVPGGSIASILARFGALDEAVFRKYTRQILEGVVYLHQNDVIHRDIKGGNVMLMPNGVIKLIDFGCAKRLCINLSMGQSQILKSMKGTPYWMAPEVVNETGHGKKSDIWSVGCTVFEMATRKPPWADMNPMAAIFAIGSDKPVPQLPDKFSEEAKEFVNSCLTKDQNKRLSASDLLQCPFLKKRSKKNSSVC